ncbi:MAG: sigma-70 family RNA polymerase sigma factor [Gemmatimonadetes bacterium]|nr:sigma-70 family RNA polymerase sigma factor [Gemmatimonadota bacterium]
MIGTDAAALPSQLRVAGQQERVVAEVTDEELVVRLRNGNVAAYDQIVSRHMRSAFSVAYRLLGQREDAEDLVQDAFMVALEKIDTFKEGNRFAPWFFRILVNRGLNARKARSLRQTDALPADISTREPTPHLEAERSQLRERLDAAVAVLPERQRAIVKLFELEGFTSPEIAEMLELSDGTVRWHLHQARQTLRQALAPFARRNP